MQNYLVLFSLLCLVACTGNKQGAFNTISSKDSDRVEMGLKIEYKTTRGQTIEDSLGVMYSLRYIPSSFTNQSEDPINIQISFSDNYDYPPVYNNDKFRTSLY